MGQKLNLVVDLVPPRVFFFLKQLQYVITNPTPRTFYP